MTAHLHRIASIVLLILLAGCGGGGDDGGNGNPALTAFLGSWQQSCLAEGSNSGSGSMNFNRLNGDTLSGQATVNTYTGNTTCSGTPVVQTGTVSLTYDGIKVVDGVSAVKVLVRLPDGSSEKTLLYTRDNKLYFGVDNNIGTDGYPNAIDFTDSLTRI